MTVDWGLVLSVALPVGLGAAAGFATRDGVRSTWYAELEKPSWQPPAYLFGPVWTVLYVLMGLAAWRVWKAGARAEPMLLYGVQLALNIVWSFLFFSAKNLKWALFEIIALWGVLVATTVTFYNADRTAGYLMVPYLAWVTFACILTYTIYRRNRDARQRPTGAP